MDQIAQFGHKESLKCAPAARYPLTFYSYMRSTSQALSFMFEWIFVVGLGAKVKRDWAKPRISPFRRQFCSSITRHWNEFLNILALQYQGTVRPHACASWLKCPSYAAPVKSAKGRVGDRVPYVTLINQHLVIARLLHSPRPSRPTSPHGGADAPVAASARP